MAEKQRILIVDDDANIAELISLYLMKECYETMIVGDGEEALKRFPEFKPNLVLLDLMLPGMDGYQVCRELRASSQVPIIMLSAKGEIFDKVLGLELGADDYMIKPFDSKELVARVKAQMRRYTQYNDNTKKDDDVIDFSGLILKKQSHECIYNEQVLTLTPTEFEILWLLCENRGKVMSSEKLFETVWKETYYKNSNNTVMVHIRHLREKLSGPTGKSDLIKTVWGVGYKIEE